MSASDRVIFQEAKGDEDALPPHVDQNPHRNPDFASLQGMIALKNMNETTGTLALIPKSKQFFHSKYKQWCNKNGSYVEYKDDDLQSFIALDLQEGDLAIWDSRTTHGRYRSPEPSNDRYAMLVSFIIAREEMGFWKSLRSYYFKEGTGYNHPEAGLRATSSPRCKISLRQHPESLTELGKRIYGQESWETPTITQIILGGILGILLAYMFLFVLFAFRGHTRGVIATLMA